MNVRCWLTGIAFALVLAGTSCGGGGGGGGGGGAPPSSPPSISDLTYSPTAVPVTSTPFIVNGSFNFSDSGGDLATLTITVLDPSGKQLTSTTTPLQGASGHTSGTITGTIQVAASGVGIYTFRLSVSDTGGSRSNELSGALQLVAVASQAPLVAKTGGSPTSLAVGGGSVYWSQDGEDVLQSAPVGGGSVSTWATKMVNPGGVAFVGTDVIWLDDRSGPGICTSSTQTRFLKRTTANGLTTVLASSSGCAGGTTDIVALDDTVYWVSSTSSPDTYVINATSLSNGSTATITSSLVPVAAMTARGNILYWMENELATSSSAIRSIPAAGGAITTIASGFDSAVNSFAVDDNSVYYTTPNYPRTSPTNEALIAQAFGGGSPTTLLPSVSTPVRLVATGSAVAWLSAAGLYSIPTAGGNPNLLAAISDTPTDLAFDGTNLVWAEYSGTGLSIASRLSSIPAGGGTTNVRYQGTDVPLRIAIDLAGRVNLTERSDSMGPGPDGSGRVARLTNSNAVQTLVAGLADDHPPFVYAGSVVWVADFNRIKRIASTGSMPEVLAVDSAAIPVLAADSTSIYWATSAPSAVRKVPMAGGVVTTLIDSSALGMFAGTPGPLRVAPDGDLYWVASQNNVLSIPSSSPSTSAKIIAQGLPAVSDLTVDASHIFVAIPANSNVLSYPLDGGSSTVLASNVSLGGPILMAVDGATLYWLAGGNISKIPAAGGTATEVIEFDGALGASSFAVDASNVYFAEPTQQEIHRTAK